VVGKGNKATLRFTFSTVGGDVCFGAVFVPNGEEAYNLGTIVRERTREQAHLQPVQVNQPALTNVARRWSRKGSAASLL